MAEKIKDTEYGGDMEVLSIGGRSTREPPEKEEYVWGTIWNHRGEGGMTVSAKGKAEALPKQSGGGCRSGSIRIWGHNVPVITDLVEGGTFPFYMDCARRRMDPLLADNGLLHELRMAAASDAYYTSEQLRDMYDIARWAVLTAIEQDTDHGRGIVPAPSYEDLQDASVFEKYAPEAKQRVVELRERQNAWVGYNRLEDRVDMIPRALMFRTAYLCMRTDDPLKTLDNKWELFHGFFVLFADDLNLEPRFPDYYGEIMRLARRNRISRCTECDHPDTCIRQPA